VDSRLIIEIFIPAKPGILKKILKKETFQHFANRNGPVCQGVVKEYSGTNIK